MSYEIQTRPPTRWGVCVHPKLVYHATQVVHETILSIAELGIVSQEIGKEGRFKKEIVRSSFGDARIQREICLRNRVQVSITPAG